jgi:hypothetical protein
VRSGRVEINPRVHVSDLESNLRLRDANLAALEVSLDPVATFARDEGQSLLAVTKSTA